MLKPQTTTCATCLSCTGRWSAEDVESQVCRAAPAMPGAICTSGHTANLATVCISEKKDERRRRCGVMMRVTLNMLLQGHGLAKVAKSHWKVPNTPKQLHQLTPLVSARAEPSAVTADARGEVRHPEASTRRPMRRQTAPELTGTLSCGRRRFIREASD